MATLGGGACGASLAGRSGKTCAEKRKRSTLTTRLALRRNAAAARTFSDFSPSHRREYVEWIEEAKRPENRQKRIATTIAWAAKGKSRNWKYDGC